MKAVAAFAGKNI